MTDYTTYRYRFVVLACFCLAQIANAMSWVTFAPIARYSQTYYGIDADKVNGFSILFMAAYLPGSAISAWVYTRLTLKWGVSIGIVGTALGCWIRLAESYGGVMVGQAIAALAQPILMNAPARLAAAWFPASERSVATSLGAISNPVGIALGTVFPSVFVTLTNGTNPLGPIPVGSVLGMSDLLIFEAAYATGVAALVVALVRSRPPTPPSASQEQALADVEKDVSGRSFLAAGARVLRDAAQCFTYHDFRVLFVAFGVGLGLFNAITTLIEQLTAPVCSTADDASLYGGLMVGIGILGAIGVGIVLDRSHAYRFWLRMGYGLGFVAGLGLTLVMQTNLKDATAFFFAFVGFVIIPMLPCSFEAAVEATYPIAEDVSNGLLMCAGNYLGIAFIFLINYFIKQQKPCNINDTTFIYPGSYVTILVALFVSSTTIFLFRGDARRLEAEKRPLVGAA